MNFRRDQYLDCEHQKMGHCQKYDQDTLVWQCLEKTKPVVFFDLPFRGGVKSYPSRELCYKVVLEYHAVVEQYNQKL